MSKTPASSASSDHPSLDVTPAAPGKEREAHTKLHPDVLSRLVTILGTQIPDVFSTHRALEAKIEVKDKIGRQNLLEALSHISVLFQRGHEMNRDEQLEQIVHLEDHLRRVMMETFEQDVNALIGEQRDGKNNLERAYYRRAAPLIRIGRLQGHIIPEEVDARFKRIADRCVSARRAKVADGGWDDWKYAAAELQDAAAEVNEVQRELRTAVEAAHSSWRFGFAVTLTIILFAASHLLI